MGTDGVYQPVQPAPVSEETSEKQSRDRSTVQFPYSDLDSAVEVARTIHHHAGLECDVEQLAGWMDQSASSGTFRSRYSAARIFGFTETLRGGRVVLTSLGQEVLDPGKEGAAKATAFLNVELFSKMFDLHKGHQLPPPPAIERIMGDLGVSPKQRDRARQTFIKSAQQSRFDRNTGRFIRAIGHRRMATGHERWGDTRRQWRRRE